MKFAAPPGVFDIIPDDKKEPWHNSGIWNYVENTFRRSAQLYGFKEIRTPVFERTELFERGVGEGTDVVSKEMYTFVDKGGRSLTLRPEGTAPVMRAFIEHGMAQEAPCHKFYYIGPMFRYERAQAGRYRQFHQFGAEIIGLSQPEQDAELIDMAVHAYKSLGLKNLKIYLNSIGNTEARQNYREALKSYFLNSFDKLSKDSQYRLTTNPLRILDSKAPEDQEFIADAPSILEYLDPDSKEHFEKVQNYLNLLNIPFIIQPRLVRGLDYYNRTVFEIVSEDIGAQSSVGGGGRFDGLLKTLGGPDLPCTGFATGIERVIHTMLKQQVPIPSTDAPVLYMIPLGENAKEECFKIVHALREQGIPVQIDLSGRKLNKALQFADQLKSKFVTIVGDDELKSGVVELKEMSTGIKTKAPLHNLERILQIEESSEEFIKLWQEMSKPFEKQDEAEFFIKRLNRNIEMTQKLANELQKAMEGIEGYFDDKPKT